MFHILLYKWNFSNIKAQKLPRGMLSFIKIYTQMFMVWYLLLENKHITKAQSILYGSW